MSGSHIVVLFCNHGMLAKLILTYNNRSILGIYLLVLEYSSLANENVCYQFVLSRIIVYANTRFYENLNISYSLFEIL